MIKVTIILIILAVIASIVSKLIGSTMSVDEAIVAQIRNEFPLRVTISVGIFLILSVAAFICLIITIVTW